MELISEVNDALSLREFEVKDALSLREFGLPASIPTEIEGQSFVFQTSMTQFRDAVISGTPFDAEKQFSSVKESLPVCTTAAIDSRQQVEASRQQIKALADSIAHTNALVSLLRNDLTLHVDEFSQVRSPHQ